MVSISNLTLLIRDSNDSLKLLLFVYQDSNLIFSLTNSNNIKNQKGVFTWNANTFKPLEMLGNEQYDVSRTENDSEDYRFSGCYNINKKLVPYIKQQAIINGTEELIDAAKDTFTVIIT